MVTVESLSDAEKEAITNLHRYGGAEDCRSSFEQVRAFESLAAKGLVTRNADETCLNKNGREMADRLRDDKN